MNGLAAVLLVPFVAAMVLALLNEHPRLARAVNVATCVGLTGYVFWLLGLVDQQGVQVSRIAGYAPPYGPVWDPLLIAARKAAESLGP